MGKRLLALIPAFCLLLVPFPIHAASSAEGSTLRLGKTAGEVAITNQNGGSVSVREGAKLYNGYTVTTGAPSRKEARNQSVNGQFAL